ncbi:hypothetical protein [Hymenobacter sp.]|jgi:hypothetical protein|uniref:hypothetical protein n=1 Tax=Hymenobacter sp. TaxID=1898978 RepID=UPI002ED94726
MSNEYWQNVLNNFVFKITDGFAFAGVSKKTDLFPKGLKYFSDWQLDIISLVEAEDDIVCKFNLNDNCKQHFVKFEFAVHSFESDEFNNYCEFDQLYFFSGERLVATYINHESMIDFLDLTDDEAALIETLDPHIKGDFVDLVDF